MPDDYGLIVELLRLLVVLFLQIWKLFGIAVGNTAQGGGLFLHRPQAAFQSLLDRLGLLK